MIRSALPLVALAACKPAIIPYPENVPHSFALAESLPGAKALGDGTNDDVWVAVDDDFAVRRAGEEVFEFVGRGNLPPGEVVWMGTLQGSREWLFAEVFGQGMYQSWAGSGEWTKVESLVSPTLNLIKPGTAPIPRDMVSTPEGVTFLATLGGLYLTADEGATWDPVDMSSAGETNLLFNAVDALEDRVIAVAMLPDALIPASAQGLLGGRVFVSDNNGLTWRVADGDFPSNHATSAAIADGEYYIGTMDHGVIRGSGDGTWTPLFGPTDVVDIEWAEGGLNVASASRGLWRLEDEVWTQVGDVPAIGTSGGLGLLADGQAFELEEGEGNPPPAPAGGEVHLALSFHVNYYHSYRGDTNDEDGFGKDIRVIRTILDWLDAHPQVKADWDSDNLFTTDTWMAQYSPDIIQRIRARVESGQDDIRLMSWNNGAMASSTDEEFTIGMQEAKNSNEVAFGEWEPGVQPQENMVSPDDLKRYTDLGIDWITLFYGANGFTGPRNDIVLRGPAAYNAFALRDPQTNAFMTGVPVYHHADMLDHGGLRGWIQQLSARHSEDTLLVIHFDADGESWENFGAELDAIADLDVRYTTIASYLGNHEPMADQVLVGDIADGVGDGYSSWGEKAINHEVWTLIEQARRLEAATRTIVPQPDTDLSRLLDDSVHARMRALSTTNYGLATPQLHPDRERSAVAYAELAVAEAQAALDYAEQLQPLPINTLEFVNPLQASGPVIVPFQLRMGAGSWEGEAGLLLDRSNTPLPMRAFFNRTDGPWDIIDVYALIDMPSQGRVTVEWSYDPGDPQHATGDLGLFDAPPLPVLQPPMAECRGQSAVAQGGTIGAHVDQWGLQVSRSERWTLPTCSGSTVVNRVVSRISNMEGVLVDVSATIDDPSDADDLLSIALSPFTCPEGIESIKWRTHSGSERERDVPAGRQTWNPVSADGWAEFTCGDGTTMQIAIEQTLRGSMGPFVLRTDGDDGLIAPLGTLWGNGPWHDSRATDGIGIADQVTPVIGSHFFPSAPDWAGRDVRYRLWVTSGTPTELLDMFSHPPVVRVGP